MKETGASEFLGAFLRQIRARSEEHRRAILLLKREQITSQMVSVLRQELDSLIRVIFLLKVRDRDYRRNLIRPCVEGRKWLQKGSKRRITDRQMVDIAKRLHGWSESVYRFGCAFIHLSKFHDHKVRDRLAELPKEERDAILQHVRAYHGGIPETFHELEAYSPLIFQKISDNLVCYLKMIERDEDLDE